MKGVLCIGVDDFALQGYGLDDEGFPLPVDIVDEADIAGILPRVTSYDIVVVGDASFQSSTFSLQVGPKLKQVFDKAGTVVVLGYFGVFAVPETLSRLFGCRWKFAAYTREEFKATRNFRDHFRNGPQSLRYLKSNLLAVGPGEAMYVPTTCAETYTPVAVHTGSNGGRLVYFGTPNFEDDFCELLQEICYNSSLPAGKFFPPCAVLFTQASIKSEFKNGKSLEETACQLACSDMQKRDLPMIQVVQHVDGFMYSLDNRRLAVFRLLQLTGIIRRIKVLVVPMDHRQWRNKFDNESDHTQIRVRGVNFIIGSSLETTTFPLERIRSAAGSARHVAALAVLLAEMESDEETSETTKAQAKAGYPRPGVETVVPRAAGRQRRKHILQYSKTELINMGWTGEQYLSHSQRRMAPYIPGMDSDSDYSYDDLQNVPEHLLPKSWKP